MSENLTENDVTVDDAIDALNLDTEETTTPALTWQERLGEVTDGSRVADMGAVEKFVTNIRTMAAVVVDIAKKQTDAVKAVAAELANRSLFLTDEGNPDWAGGTMAYRAVAEATLNEVFGEIDDKRTRDNLTSSIRQHVNRTYRELAMVAYVASMTTDGGDPLFPGILDETGSVNPEHAAYDVFKARMRAEYRSAGLKVPTQYQTPQDKAAAAVGNPQNGGTDARSILSKGLDVVKEGNVADDYAAGFLLEGISAFVLEIANPRRDGGITNREFVKECLDRIRAVAYAGVKACDSVLNADDREALGEVVWNEHEDPAKYDR